MTNTYHIKIEHFHCMARKKIHLCFLSTQRTKMKMWATGKWQPAAHRNSIKIQSMYDYKFSLQFRIYSLMVLKTVYISKQKKYQIDLCRRPILGVHTHPAHNLQKNLSFWQKAKPIQPSLMGNIPASAYWTIGELVT